ncbi:lysozyme [Methylorubrum salsuginis]|uniref:Lysozyme n=1 Tax=Methylorubrum salsuginis TaxID=414703 RepID=A0A1I4CF26_9HYPH|nr:lysozyme [Methylorubrum salsuginis]SFK79545.1 lysozyme [Methylorubrum salsuginis]
MDLSRIGEAALVAREGRRLEAYRDSVGIWTIGVGHTAAAGPPLPRAGLRITAAECDAIFARDIARFVRTVDQALPAPLPQHAFDALVSLAFNIGPAAFLRSTVLRRLRAGDREGAAEAMLMWNRPAVLIPRRQAEVDQFRTPYETALPRARRGDPQPVAAPAPVRPDTPAAPPIAAAPPAGWLARLRAWLGGSR